MKMTGPETIDFLIRLLRGARADEKRYFVKWGEFEIPTLLARGYANGLACALQTLTENHKTVPLPQ